MSSSIVPLLIWRNSLLVLDLSLDILNGVRRLDLKSDGLTREGFYEDLHSQLTKTSPPVEASLRQFIRLPISSFNLCL